jgi:hypothetical protein
MKVASVAADHILRLRAPAASRLIDELLILNS